MLAGGRAPSASHLVKKEDVTVSPQELQCGYLFCLALILCLCVHSNHILDLPCPVRRGCVHSPLPPWLQEAVRAVWGSLLSVGARSRFWQNEEGRCKDGRAVLPRTLPWSFQE